MKLHPVLSIVVAGFLAGCAQENSEFVYQKPLTSPGGKFTTLPPAVQNTVRAEVGAAEIDDIRKDTSSGTLVYDVRFKNADLYPPLHIAPDGSVLTPDLAVAVGASEDTIAASTGSAVSGIKLDDLPPTVVKTIREKAPTAEVETISKITAGINVAYEVSFKDPAQPKLFISDDGKVVVGK
jgi:hypothetical protein